MNAIDDVSWIRSSRPSFREAHSRGSQTTTCDVDEFNSWDEENDFVENSSSSRPLSPASNIRRASFLLGGLQALYSSQPVEDVALTSVQQLRSPPSPRNPWNIHFRVKVLPELKILCTRIQVNEQKRITLIHTRNLRYLKHCFFCWRQSNVKLLNQSLDASIEQNSATFYKARRASLVKVWSHIAVGLNAQKAEAFQNRGGIDAASEAIAQRVLSKNEEAKSISASIDEEADHLLRSKYGLDIWLTGYRKITYFRLWRESIRLPTKYYRRKRCTALLVSWKALSKAAIDLKLDSRYEEAKSFHRLKLINAVVKRWQLRMTILKAFASLCLRLGQSIEVKQTELKQRALQKWSRVAQDKRVYCQLPFDMWREITFNDKHRARVQSRLVSVFLRAKSRMSLRKMLRLWREQLRYSEITALYTKDELAAQLMQQKRSCQRLKADNKAMKAKLKSYDRLQLQLREAEEARNRAEQELFKRDINRGISYRTSLDKLCPILMQPKNML